MSKIVFARNGQALTTSVVIANGVGVEHRALRQLLRNYQADFESFGVLTFEMSKPKNPQGGRPETYAILNEQQATLLVTYCKNTETVRKFKVALVKAFYEMREQLHPQSPAQAQLPALTLTEQQSYQILSEVAKRCKRNGVHYQTVYRALKARYQVTKYTHILQRDFEDAIEFIRTVDLRTPIVPEKTPEPEKIPEKRPQIVATPEFCEHLRTLVYNWRYLFRKEIDLVYQTMRAMESPHAGMLWEAIHDLNLIFLEDDLEKVGFPVKEMKSYQHWALRNTTE